MVKNERKRIQLTQKETAHLAEISIPALRQVERTQGHIQSFQKVLQALRLTLEGQHLPAGDTLGGRIHALRRGRGVSQKTLARLAEVTRPTIQALERAGTGRLSTLDRVLTILGSAPFFSSQETPTRFFSHLGYSSTHHGWQTPPELLERLYAVVGTFDLDPCSPTHTKRHAPVKAHIYYTIADDGLQLPWHGVVFLNPPYGRALPQWVEKARHEVLAGRAHAVIALIPARTETQWWHRFVAGSADVLLLRGRLSFASDTVKSEWNAPFASAVVVWGGSSELLQQLRAVFADAWYIPSAVSTPVPTA